jgi:hypothetical protein
VFGRISLSLLPRGDDSSRLHALYCRPEKPGQCASSIRGIGVWSREKRRDRIGDYLPSALGTLYAQAPLL